MAICGSPFNDSSKMLDAPNVPALTMRGRYLMREYWADADLFLRLSAEERELYVGLWMLADDSGWLPRDVPGIAGALLRYEDRGPREAKIRLALRRLGAMGKVSSLRCGCLHLPAVTKYPRAGKKSTEHYQNHLQHQTGSNGFEGIQIQHSNPDKSDLNASPVPSRRTPTQSDNARERDEYDEEVAAKMATKLGVVS